LTRLLEQSIMFSTKVLFPLLTARYFQVEPPVRGSRCPRKSSRTELELAGAQVKPMDVFINKMSRKISDEYGPWNEL
jgi:hypothetical protein